MAVVVLAGAWFAPAASSASPAESAAMPVADALEAFGAQLPRVHKPAPDFLLPRVDGGRMQLAELRGKVVLVHFWATWCVACRHEMPQIQRLAETYGRDGLVVLGVNVDRGNPGAVRAFLRERNVRFPSVLDPDGAVRNRYAVRALPTSYLIGRDGRTIARVIGERDWSTPLAAAMMRAVLVQ